MKLHMTHHDQLEIILGNNSLYLPTNLTSMHVTAPPIYLYKINDRFNFLAELKNLFFIYFVYDIKWRMWRERRN